MSVENVLSLIQENEVKFVDLRFTDTKSKEQHISIPAHQIDADFFEDGKCSMVHQLLAGKASTNLTW